MFCTFLTPRQLFMSCHCCVTLCDHVLKYPTAKVVKIKSLKIGLLNRFVQLVIISYIIIYAIIYKKGYQEFDYAQSSVTTKVKGVGSTLHRNDLPVEYRRIWDTPDYVVPPLENGAFFVLTNAIITPNQTRSICAETSAQAICDMRTSKPCMVDSTLPTGNGVMTGKCVPFNKTTNMCEVNAWCPVEREMLPNSKAPLLPSAQNFTVLVKNMIEFPEFKVKLRNIPSKINNDSYLRQCLYNVKTDPLCPLFRLGYITQLAGANFDDLALVGGVINIIIDWDCNLDYDAEKYCMPKYRFARLDSADTKISPGYNYRYATYYRRADGIETRDLTKAYGILFMLTVNGKAGKFKVVPLVLNIGAGLALLGLARLVSDFLLLNVVKNRRQYREHKFVKVVDVDYPIKKKSKQSAGTEQSDIGDVSVIPMTQR